jgi:uncharacterized protein
MVNFFIIHGSNGNRDSHWYPWLDHKLSDLGNEVIRLQFPVGEEQNLENWLDELKQYADLLEDSILIGHSLGASFILNVLALWVVNPRAVFLISGFVDLLGDSSFDDVNKTFVEEELDWEKIKRSCEHFYLIYSNNDPYVPIEKVEKIARNLDTEIIFVKGGGHFQTQSGFKEFPLLLEKVKEQL